MASKMKREILPAPDFLKRIIGLVGATAGLLVMAIAWSIPIAHTKEGGFTLEGWWTGILGVVIVLSSIAWWSRWRLAGILSGMLILGMSAQLMLLSPHWLMYFRLRSLSSNLDYLSVGIIIIQFVVVGLIILPHIKNVVFAIKQLITPVRLLVIGIVFIACAVQVNVFYPEIIEHKWALRLYLEQLAAAAFIITINLLNLFGIAATAPAADLKRLYNWVGARFSIPGKFTQPKRYDKIYPWLLALFTFSISGFFSLYVFDGSPHIPDDAGYLFQARIFATGSTSVPAPPVPEAFSFYTLVVEDGKWFSVMIPGWPAVLSLGVLLGIPWLVNPAIGSLSIPVAHAVIRRVTDYGTANFVALLLATSPWLIFLSASLQPQPSSLLFCLLSMLCLLRAAELHSWKFAVLGGFAAGLVFCIRPLDGVLYGAAAGIYMLCMRTNRPPFTHLISFGAGCVITGALLLMYNFHETGSILEMSYENYFNRLWSPGANRLGFGPDIGRLWGIYDKIPGHGWRDVLINFNQNMFNLNTELFGWCIGSLFPVVFYLLFSRWSVTDRISLLFIGIIVAGLSLYWYSGGSAYGPRYWYLIIIPVTLLGAQGWMKIAAIFDEQLPGQFVPMRVSLIVAVLIFSSLFVFDTWRAVAKYKNYLGNNDRYLQLKEKGVFGKNGLVLVESSPAKYTSAFYLNEISPRKTGPVFVRYDNGEYTRQLLESYPDRPVFHVKESWNPEGEWLQISKYQRDGNRLIPLDITNTDRDK